MATPEQVKESSRRRKANQRAREKGLPEPYPVTSTAVEEAEKGEREVELLANIAWAKAQDDTGKFYKAECRPAMQLLTVYNGNNYVGKEEIEERDPKTGKKKQNIPNPSTTPIRIPAIEAVIDGVVVNIDPDDPTYGHLMEVDRKVTFPEWLDLRDKARRDLFWLANVVGKRLYHKTHQPVCNMFVKKDFTGVYYPGFNRNTVSNAIAKQQRFMDDQVTPTRTAMIFAPRGGWKSTIDGIDAVQWMLNAPDVRIMIITAFRNLSRQFLGEIKDYFYLAPRAEASTIQLLFPEYVLTGVDGRSEQPIECPAEVLMSKEPHVWVTSMESSITGQRCDICKADDIVDPKNSTDEELRQSLVEKFNGALNLTESWGLVDIIGTRYFTDDYYGTRMQPDDDGIISPFSLMAISAWYPKPQFRAKYELLLEQPNGMSQVTEDMVDLWFPAKLSFAVLRRKLLETKERRSTNIQKERNFRNQYLNIATDPQEVSDLTTHFSRDVLRAHTYPRTSMPVGGEKIVTLDYAYTENRGSDWSVLAAIVRHVREDGTQELIVEDIHYGKWKASELALNTVLFLRKHTPSRTLIERALGIDLLMIAVDMHARRIGREDLMQSIKLLTLDNSKNAKTNRIKTLEILLADDRLHFVSGPWIDELYRQFERFTGETKKGRHDDIPDAISFASRTLPNDMFITILRDTEQETLESEEEMKRLAKARHYQTYFGNRNGTIHHPGQPQLPAPTMSEWATGRRKDRNPAPVEEIAPPKPQDPRMRIFGNKGPWRL